MYFFLITSEARACAKDARGGACGAETSLGEWETAEHSRFITPPHTHCQQCGRAFTGAAEGVLLIVPPEYLQRSDHQHLAGF